MCQTRGRVRECEGVERCLSVLPVATIVAVWSYPAEIVRPFSKVARAAEVAISWWELGSKAADPNLVARTGLGTVQTFEGQDSGVVNALPGERPCVSRRTHRSQLLAK
eukprot:6178579-Pleurochrysis_carterae.AAC.2